MTEVYVPNETKPVVASLFYLKEIYSICRSLCCWSQSALDWKVCTDSCGWFDIQYIVAIV